MIIPYKAFTEEIGSDPGKLRLVFPRENIRPLDVIICSIQRFFYHVPNDVITFWVTKPRNEKMPQIFQLLSIKLYVLFFLKQFNLHYCFNEIKREHKEKTKYFKRMIWQWEKLIFCCILFLEINQTLIKKELIWNWPYAVSIERR